jgi:hypothetical protein
MDIMHAELLSIAENIVLHSQAAFNWVMDPKNRTIVKTILWIGAVSLLLILTVNSYLCHTFSLLVVNFGLLLQSYEQFYLVIHFIYFTI